MIFYALTWLTGTVLITGILAWIITTIDTAKPRHKQEVAWLKQWRKTANPTPGRHRK